MERKLQESILKDMRNATGAASGNITSNSQGGNHNRINKIGGGR